MSRRKRNREEGRSAASKRSKNDRKRAKRKALNKDELEAARAVDRERKRIKKSHDVASHSTDDVDHRLSNRQYVLKNKKKFDQDMVDLDVKEPLLLFEAKLNLLKIDVCDNCKTYYWSKERCYCYHQKFVLESNLLKIGVVPNELADLSFVEQLVIARVHPVVSIYRLKSGQRAYSGHVTNFRQDVFEFAKVLPHSLTTVKGLVPVCCSTDTFHQDFLIRRNSVSIALHWLKTNNKYYHDIEIDMSRILSLPEESYVSSTKTGIDVDSVGAEVDSDDTDITRSGFPDGDCFSTLEKLEHQLQWPTVESKPINEFTTVGYICQSFPCLFPYGEGDYVENKTISLTARVYFRYLLSYHDKRFVRHPVFPYFALNSLMRWDALNKGTVYLKKHSNLKNMNVELFKEMICDSAKIPKNIMVYSSNIRGSRAYWSTRSMELQAMVSQLNVPSLFFTLTAADRHWPFLFEIILADKEAVSTLTEGDRSRILIEDAGLCSDFFFYSSEIFITEFLVPFLSAYDYWYRYEWQTRGVGHVHGLLWLVDAPTVDGVKVINDELNSKIIEYFEKLITAVTPDTNYVMTDNHPSRMKLSEVTDCDQDVAALLNCLQKHVCSKKCQTKSGKSEDLKCRYGFPFELQEHGSVVKNKKGYFEFLPPRNHPHLNKCMLCTLVTWRGNGDATALLSKGGCMHYCAKYSSKSERQSAAVTELFKNIIHSSSGADDSVKHLILQMFVKCTVERDISFQECHHVLRGHKLYSCSRSFVFLNLRSSDWIVHSNLEDLQENVNLGTYDVMICYTKRPSILDNLNLYDYAKKFNHQTNKPKKRENIVRIYPLLSQKLLKSSDLDEEVCRQVVLLFVPWRNIDLEEDMSLSWAEIYVKYQLSVKLLPYFDVDEKVSSDLSDDSDEEVKKSKEDWMYVCEVKGNVPHQVELGYRTVDMNYSWNRSAEMVSKCIVVCNTIQDAKKSKVLQQERTTNHIELSADQKSVLSVVRQQILKINGRLNDEVSTPQIVLCEGLAGSGKTATLNAVVELIHEYCGKDSVLVLAPTGSSALQAQGVTVHSALRLGYNATGHVPDLKGEALYYWRKDHINVKFVLIEEYSMVGCRLLYNINKRLCLLQDNHLPFGNLFIYFFGNMRQLKPVADTPLYCNPLHARDDIILSGLSLFSMIDKVILLSVPHRQKNIAFLDFLVRYSQCTVTEADTTLIKQRFWKNLSIEDKQRFSEGVHLYSTRAAVHDFNLKQLIALNCPVVKVDAENNSKVAAAASEDKVGLSKCLYIGVGCRIILRRNLWTNMGLVNGAMGVVIDIVYDESSVVNIDPPRFIVVKFDNYSGPVLDTGGVPIERVVVSWYEMSRQCSRVQFPLMLCYAVTIYRSQGLTLNRVAIHVDKKERHPGEYYVAMSRVKDLCDLCIIIEDDALLFSFNYSLYSERFEGEARIMGRHL